METIVEITLKIKVPTRQVDEVSQRIIDLLSELDVHNGLLEQGKVTINI